jgi:anti-sigma factor ChrR (cupin superfamily)
MTQTIHGDISVRVAVHTKSMPWSESPSGTVWRKRLHLVGPTESGQVTSVVHFQEHSRFPAHDHPDGEEILVLSGVFSDEYGDWPAGSYLLNPEGFRHAPYSRSGCLLFVKLRQYPGKERNHVAVNTLTMSWEPVGAGCERKVLYAQSGYQDTTRLERWSADSALGEMAYPSGAELFVIDGSFEDEHGRYEALTWIRLPQHFTHRPATHEGCVLYFKEGGFAYLRSASASRGIVGTPGFQAG